MCILAISKTKRPSLEMLQKFECANGDGGGLAWFGKDNKAHYKKNLNAAEVFKISQHLPLPFVIHFRLASCGGKNPLLTHPFVMSKESPLMLEGRADKLLAHNGHCSSWELLLAAANIRFPKDNSPVSDTRAIAAIASQNEEEFLSMVNGNYAVMDATVHKINLYGKFEEEDGIIFSNMTWKYAKKYSYHQSRPSYTHTQGSYDFETNSWGDDYSNYGHNNVTGGSRRKEKREAWKQKEALRIATEKAKAGIVTALKENEPVVDINENAGTFELENKPPVLKGLHSEPPSPHFAENTRKILGWPQPFPPFQQRYEPQNYEL